MKFLSLALLATPVLTQSLKQALEGSPHGKLIAKDIGDDKKAQDAFVPAGKSQVTLFLPTDKALENHRSNAPRPGQKSKRALLPNEYEIASYSSADGKLSLSDLGQDKVLKTQNTDATTGKPNDLVTEGGVDGKLPNKLMARTNMTFPDVSVFGGLGAKAKIVAGDVLFDCGVIHFVDMVLDVPKRCSFTINSLGYKNFQAALAEAGLTATIDQSTTTLFSYADDVFTSTADKSPNTLKQHIVPGFIAYSPVLDDVKTLTTAANTTLKVSYKNGQYFINNSPIIRSNVICNNGVVHTLGKLLVDPIVTYKPGSDAASSRVNQMTIVGALFLTVWNYLV
ncbi:FAS1 domain-containing protein [Tuber magnatum]|uniref:FAS1 domain-containing protein n=1 Tax=Tuber magnatum TaxID=42249 RepID=A0A317SID9_9PEZI|nr:FAS1 domain-containing protein [Tuber magnatum]